MISSFSSSISFIFKLRGSFIMTVFFVPFIPDSPIGIGTGCSLDKSFNECKTPTLKGFLSFNLSRITDISILEILR